MTKQVRGKNLPEEVSLEKKAVGVNEPGRTQEEENWAHSHHSLFLFSLSLFRVAFRRGSHTDWEGKL